MLPTLVHSQSLSIQITESVKKFYIKVQTLCKELKDLDFLWLFFIDNILQNLKSGFIAFLCLTQIFLKMQD